ncbi:hypothetical protein ACFU99_25570, partial [Streptomyces sp. NPDC057654]
MSDAPAAACPDCGTPARQEGQSFCDSCGGFLRWDSSPATSPADSSSKKTPEVDTSPPPRPAPTPRDGGSIQGGRLAPRDGSPHDRGAPSATGSGTGSAGPQPGQKPGADAQGGPYGSNPAPAPHTEQAPTAPAAPSAPLPPAGPMPGAAAPGAADGASQQARPGFEDPDTENTIPMPPAPGDRRARRDADDDWPMAQNAAEPAEPPQPAPNASHTPEAPETPTAPPARPGADWEPHRPVEPPNRSDTAIRALLVPVPDATPPSAPPEAPGSVLPGRPETQRPRVRTPGVPMADFGDPCRYCSTVNPPRRHFCRQCASPLSDERDAIAEGPYAGQRPRLHREHGRWITRVLLTLLLVGVIVGGVFGGPPAARAIQDHF